MKTSSRPRKTSARKPSHFGSYKKSPAEGSASVSFASIGSIGGASGQPRSAGAPSAALFSPFARGDRAERAIAPPLIGRTRARRAQGRSCDSARRPRAFIPIRRRVAVRGPRRPPVARHSREVDERLVIARFDRVLDLIVTAAACFLGERNADRLGVVVGPRALHVLGERRFRRVPFRIALREHLLHETEAVMTDEHPAARMAAHTEQVIAECVEIAARERNVLARMIAVALDELRDLRLFAPVDAFDERDAEVAVVDAPQLHAAVLVVRAHVIDAGHERAAFDLDMKPGPLLDRALRARIGYVIYLRQMRHSRLLESSRQAPCEPSIIRPAACSDGPRR